MNKGKLLKFRPGRDANCSSYAYVGLFLVGIMGYLLLLGVSVIVQIVLRTQKLRSQIGTNTRIGLWVTPHLLAVAAFLYWSFTSGAMEYGSIVCVGPITLLMLIGLGVGWATIVATAKTKQGAEASE